MKILSIAVICVFMSLLSEAQIPGITPTDVYLNFTKKGFTLNKDLNPGACLWTCKEVTAGHTFIVEVYGSNTNSIRNIRGTAINNDLDEDADDVARDFLGYLASVNYTNSEPEKLQNWVRENLGKTRKIVVSGVSVELISKPNVRILILSL